MDILSLLGVIILFILIIKLRNRVDKLEAINKNSAQPASAPITQQESKVGSTAKETTTQPKPIQQTSATSIDVVAWIKEDWLLKLGALLLLIGFGWLATYAFLNNWIGPMGRIVLGIVAGVLFLALGHFRIAKKPHQGAVFLVLGSTVILLTTFAAREIYDFFTPLSALALMFISTAYVAFVSVRNNNKGLAIISLFFAAAAPLLTNSPTPDFIALFSYLLVITLGAIWILALTNWRELTTTALIVITFYSLPHLLPFSATDGKLLLFAYAFTTLFFLTNTLGIIKSKTNHEMVVDLVTAGGNGMFLLAWIMTNAQEEWKSLLICAWMLVFTVGAFVIFRLIGKREPFYVYAGVAIAMLAAATSAELSGATLTIAFTIESAMIALVSYLILKDIKIAERLSILFVVPIVLSVESINSYSWVTKVFQEDFFVLSVLAVSLLSLGLFLHYSKSKTMSSVLMIAGSIYVYIVLWLSLHTLLNEDTAVLFSLVVYTLAGLITYFYGLTRHGKVLKIYGGILLGFVIMRLLLVDVWQMELSGRIITFFTIGALLISTAFISRKKHEN